jgi:3-oxoacyl-[acyl-carrier protein] reductase
VRLLASLGCSIGIHYNSDVDTAEVLRAELTQKHGDFTGALFCTAKADMGNYDEVRLLSKVRLCYS